MRRPLAAFGHPVSVIDRQIYRRRLRVGESGYSVVSLGPTVSKVRWINAVMSVSAPATAPNVSAPSAREKEIFAGERAARLLHQPSAFKVAEIDHGVAEALYQARYLLPRIDIVS